MDTDLHRNFDLDEETLDQHPDGPSNIMAESVLGLCEGRTTSMASSGGGTIAELPTFAEQGFTEHEIDLAPQTPVDSGRERALRKSGEWISLAGLLLERAERAICESDAATLLVQAASLYQEQMSNLPAAQAILVKAMEVDPGHSAAADALEQLVQQHGDWGELIAVFKSAAEALAEREPVTAGELWIRVACAYAAGRRDYVRAYACLPRAQAATASRVRSHLDVLERGIRHPQQLENMLALSRRIEELERTVRLLSRAVAMSQSVVERANYHHLIAELELQREEEDAAHWHWREAIRLDPRHHAARECLSRSYRARGEFRRAVELLDEARVCSADSQRRVGYACEAAQIYAEHLGENTRAVDLYAAVLQIQPGSQEASLPVVERYYQQERWAELQPVLDSLLGRARALGSSCYDAEQMAALYLKAGECAQHLRQHEKARDYFDSCSEGCPDELDALLGGARASLALGDFSRCIASIDRAVELHEAQGHSATRMAATLMLSAQAHRAVGKRDRAIALYELCVEQGDLDAMAALAELYTLRGEHHESVALRLRRAQGLEVPERIAVLCEVSDTLAQELGDVEAAIDVCWQALTIDKESRITLHRLAVLYTENEYWRDAIKTIVRMASLESGALRRARYLQAAGTIARQEEQHVEAVALLNKAMDSYFADTVMSSQAATRASCFECFEVIIDLLTEQKDWRGIERNYRKMICRLEPGDPEVGILWTALGHVYREKLGENEAAIDSFEVASSLDENRLTNHRILIDLYEGAGSDQLDKAIERRRLLLAAEPDKAEHFKALRSLYVRTRQMDRVWCICRALDQMGVADDGELAFFRRNLSSEMVWPTRPMNAEMWSRIRAVQVDPRISRIFGLVSEILAEERAESPAQVGLREVHGPQFEHLRQLFSATSYALGLPSFDCFVQPHWHDALSLINMRRNGALEPTFVLGRGLYEGRSVTEIVHGLARSLFHGRRSYYLRLALSDPSDLSAAFYAGVTLVQPEVRPPLNVGARLNTYRHALAQRLHPTWSRKLAQAAHDFLSDGDGFEVQRWSDGVDATARHAALLLCGDLHVATGAVDAEPGMSAARATRAKMQLLLDSVSEEHMTLRAELGLQIAY